MTHVMGGWSCLGKAGCQVENSKIPQAEDNVSRCRILKLGVIFCTLMPNARPLTKMSLRRNSRCRYIYMSLTGQHPPDESMYVCIFFLVSTLFHSMFHDRSNTTCLGLLIYNLHCKLLCVYIHWLHCPSEALILSRFVAILF